MLEESNIEKNDRFLFSESPLFYKRLENVLLKTLTLF